MRRAFLIGFIVCLVLTMGVVLLRRSAIEEPQPRSADPAPPQSLKVAGPKSATTDAALDGGGKAETGAHADRLAIVARELATRLQSLSMKPQMRELVARRMMRDYFELFQALHLSAEKEELLGQIIVDRFFSVIGPERDSYDKLAQDLLTSDEYEKYAAYRDELPVKAMIKEVSAALHIDGAGVASEEVGRAIRSSSNRASPHWAEVERKYMAGELNDADLSQVEQNALNQFDQSVAREVRSLSNAQLAALRDWFRGSVRATVASIRQFKGGK